MSKGNKARDTPQRDLPLFSQKTFVCTPDSNPTALERQERRRERGAMERRGEGRKRREAASLDRTALLGSALLCTEVLCTASRCSSARQRQETAFKSFSHQFPVKGTDSANNPTKRCSFLNSLMNVYSPSGHVFYLSCVF